MKKIRISVPLAATLLFASAVFSHFRAVRAEMVTSPVAIAHASNDVAPVIICCGPPPCPPACSGTN